VAVISCRPPEMAQRVSGIVASPLVLLNMLLTVLSMDAVFILQLVLTFYSQIMFLVLCSLLPIIDYYYCCCYHFSAVIEVNLC